MKSPCRDCKPDSEECRDTCPDLRVFQEKLIHYHCDGNGVVDTTDSYALTGKGD